MQTKTLSLILIIFGLFILVSGIVAYTYTITQTQTATLPIADGISIPLTLGQGDKVQGTVNILDGTQGINVYVENPNSEVVYNGGSVLSNVEFSFNAQVSGSYKVVINNLSESNPQNIEYTFTYPALPSLASIAIIIVGFFILLIGITMLMILRKARAFNKNV
ncbi:MAG: emp24/gp25L/p24 family protein [Candidatus Bathyarchaeia archaeon]|jgi:uncharacterized membrane protein